MSYMRFAKMHGAGNDFIVIDQTSSTRKFTPDRVRLLCDRRKGIGADGIILLSRGGMPTEENLVRMDFFNCDGSRASLCGNGLRCAAAFAFKRDLSNGPEVNFLTGSGVLRTKVLSSGSVRIELPADPAGFAEGRSAAGYTVYAGKVGVPHGVVFVDDPDRTDVDADGRRIRFDEAFAPEGLNVDFLPKAYDPAKPVKIRTYERGVEAETLACGTGAGAAALVLRRKHPDLKKFLLLSRSGDVLEVEFPEEWNILNKLYLTGPAQESFHGATDAFDLE